MSKEKQKALEGALNKINKKFGAGTVTKASEAEDKLIKRTIKTPSIEFNNMLGGGLKAFVELYGPPSSGKTSMAIETLAYNQKMDPNFVGAWLETEGSITKEILELHGVDLNRLIYWDQNDVDNAESALDVVRSLVSSGAVDLVIINSIAGLAPKTETEDDLEKQNIALVARLLSKFFRVITGPANKNKVTIIFINQVRDKVGVMFGCLHADTLVDFTDGRSIPIRKVVEDKIQGKVWSYNEQTKIFEEKEIIDWHYNGEVITNTDYIHIESQAYGGTSSRFGLTVTQDHEVLTQDGWKKAKDLTQSDCLVTKISSIINGTLADFMWGSFIGDSHISIRDKSTACYKLQDNENKDYLDWKLSKLPDELGMHKNGNRYESEYSSELAMIKESLNHRDPFNMLHFHYSDLGLAIWYMDDGHYDGTNGHYRAVISVKRFKGNSNALENICIELKHRGIDANYFLKNGSIVLNKEASISLFKKIAKFVPDCMQYKLPAEFQNQYQDFELEYETKNIERLSEITEIRYASNRQMRQKGKYDITVKDNHNYMVGGKYNGIIVHNSPETTTGGRAIPFYMSQRVRMNSLKIMAADPIKEGEGVKISCIVQKNRFGNPGAKTTYYANYQTGIDNIVVLPTLLQEAGIVRQAGAWWYYEDENGQPIIFNGLECKFKSKNEFLETLRNNEALKDELINRLENVGMKTESVSEEEMAEIIAENKAIESEMARIADEHALDDGEE